MSFASTANKRNEINHGRDPINYNIIISTNLISYDYTVTSTHGIEN